MQRAFGGEACAEQSTISETLNAFTEDNVEQMRQAVQELYMPHPVRSSFPCLSSYDLTNPGKCGIRAQLTTEEQLAWARA